MTENEQRAERHGRLKKKWSFFEYLKVAYWYIDTPPAARTIG